MGNTCKPMAVSFQCMTKFTTNKKKNSMDIPQKKKKIGLPYNPETSLLVKTIIQKCTCTLIQSSTLHNSQDMGFHA